MVDGFAAGGFGTGLVSGFSAGSQANARNRQLNLQERQLEQNQQAAIREQLQKNLGVVNETIDGFRSVVSEAAKNVGPERAMQFLSDPQFQAQIVQAVEVRNAFMQQLGVGGVIKPEDVMAGLRREAQSQPSAQERGRRQGQETLASATAIASGVSGTPDELAENIRTLSGISGPEAQTDIGKLRQDLGNGFITEEEFARKATEVDPDLATQNFKDANTLRDEFINQSQDFTKIRDSFARVRASAEDPSAAGDLAIIFNYMKILDPGSVVRESEFATAQNAASVPERIRAQYNRVLNGERLSDVTRRDFVDRAGRLVQSQIPAHEKLKGEYARLAQSFGIDPTQVIVDLSGDFTPIAEPPATDQLNVQEPIPRISTRAEWEALPSGTRYRDPNGVERVKQ